jgi:hypothetical protein
MRRAAQARVIVTLLVLLFAAPPGAGQDQETQVNLLAMGDWGSGEPFQRAVADRLAEYAHASGVTFAGMLLAGDNFYPDVKSIDDPVWQALFERMYDPVRLNFPFYVALGNHDYENNKMAVEMAYAKANPQSRWKLPSRWYVLDFPSQRPIVTVLMLDSNKRQMPESTWEQQRRWIGSELANRRAGWVLAVAHHPLFSNGDHGDNGELQRDWGPLLERGNVDAYICGHDHDLQHLQIPGRRTTFLLVGGGGKSIRPMRNDLRGPFSKSSYGFLHLSITRRAILGRFVDNAGETLHVFERRAAGDSRVVQTIGSDKAIPRSVRSVTRRDPAPPATVPATVPAGN